MATIKVEVVAAFGDVWHGEGQMLVATTTLGQIGILANHEPMLAALADGLFRITKEDGTVIEGKASDGFLSVEGNIVRIVARSAELV